MYQNAPGGTNGQRTARCYDRMLLNERENGLGGTGAIAFRMPVLFRRSLLRRSLALTRSILVLARVR